MKLVYSLFLIGMVSFQTLAFQNQITEAPTPIWVDPFQDSKPYVEENWPYYYLDFEKQIHLQKQRVFNHYRYQVLTADGVQEMSEIFISFDPSFQKLVLHKIVIERDNTFLDKLDLDKVVSINTESGKESHLYDGSITAMVHLDDVQKGDIIAVSYTIEGFNPVHQGHFAAFLYHGFTFPVNNFNYRVITDSNQQLFYNKIVHDIDPTIQDKDGKKVYTWTSNLRKPIELEDNLPSWSLDLPMTSISTQKNWEEVVQWALPLFRTGISDLTLPNSVAETKGKKDKAIALIRWVQDEIRYLGLESGIGAYKPNPPNKVYTQRYGDCKDKSLLLVALLQKEGISAYPLLVNTDYRHNLDKLQPSNNAFDHCVVALTLDDKNYYVDPTIANQGGDLDHNYFPDYGHGLLVKENTSELISLPKPIKPQIDILEKIVVDSIGGLAFFEIKTIYRGNKADNIRAEFDNNPLSSIQKDYLKFYNNLYPGIQVADEIKFYDDNRFGTNEVLTEEKYKIEKFWFQDEPDPFIYAKIYPVVLESMISFPEVTDRKSQYNLGRPFSFKQETHVTLPENWLVNDDEIEIKDASFKYTSQVKGNGNTIAVNYNYTLLEDFIESDRVPEFLEAHKKIKNDLAFRLTYTPAASGGNLSGLAIFVVLILLICGVFFGIKIYRNYNPKPWIYAENKAIGGWLILPAIGLSISPFRILFEFFEVGFLNKSLWANASTLGLTELVAMELVFNVLFFSYIILLIILFYSRRTSIPRLMTVFYVINVLLSLIDTEQIINFSNQEFFRAAVGAAIWIPYFNFSETVKSTFCKTYKDPSLPRMLYNQTHSGQIGH